MFRITYDRKGQKARCEYETTVYILFQRKLDELVNDQTVRNIAIEKFTV